MAVSESPFDKAKWENAAHALARLPNILARVENVTKASAVATLAAAVIGAAGRSVSIREALDIQRDIYFATYSNELSENEAYQDWAKTRDARLAKVVS